MTLRALIPKSVLKPHTPISGYSPVKLQVLDYRDELIPNSPVIYFVAKARPVIEFWSKKTVKLYTGSLTGSPSAYLVQFSSPGPIGLRSMK